MTKATKDPSVAQDLGAIADLYRTVIWMIGQRMHYGPHWQAHLDDVIRSSEYHAREDLPGREEDAVRPERTKAA